jgi:hypothetical protein
VRLKKEFVAALERELPSSNKKDLQAIADALFQETISARVSIDLEMRNIQMVDRPDLATSVKLKNAKFKPAGLTAFAAGGTLGLLAAGLNPILLTLTVISILFTAYEVCSLSLREAEASVLWAAALLGPGLPVSNSQLMQRTNEERIRFSMLTLNDTAFSSAVNGLVELGCFERLGINTFRLVERVEIKS